ncbi:hypothetical protein XENTR_v10004327 [Xenopus tropicalis]|nr:hypothetical protein XENTR_v10004327 [Xenopus tropicalis]
MPFCSLCVGVACSMLLLLILLVLLFLYRRHPQLWQQLCSKTSQNPSQPPAFSQCTQRSILEDSPGGEFWIQGNQVFCVGSPNSYQLPSYESLQEKAGQTSNCTGPEKPGMLPCNRMESPPSYEQATLMPPPCYIDASGRIHQPPPMLPASPSQLDV